MVGISALDRCPDVAAALEEDVHARVQHEPGRGGTHGADDLELLVERQQPAGARVLQVHACRACRDRTGGSTRRVAVAGLEIRRHRHLDRRGNAPDRAQHLLHGRLLAVVPAERAGHGRARRRDRAAAGKRRERPRAGHIPGIRQHEQRRRPVHGAELVGARHSWVSDTP